VETRFCLALIVGFISFFLSTPATNCQETIPNPVHPMPNGSSTVQATTCTENDGKPCPRWVHELIGQYPPSQEPGEFETPRDPHSVRFWTYRGTQDPPLRTNREVFHSKIFLASHIGGAIAMIVASRTRNSGEHWRSATPVVAGLFAMDYVQFRFVGAPNGIAAPVCEMIHYSRASSK